MSDHWIALVRPFEANRSLRLRQNVAVRPLVRVFASANAQTPAGRGPARRGIGGPKFSAILRDVLGRRRSLADIRRKPDGQWSQIFLKDPAQIETVFFFRLPGENAIDKRSKRFTPEGEPVGSEERSTAARPRLPAVSDTGESVS
jgi:hypothetical protein